MIRRRTGGMGMAGLGGGEAAADRPAGRGWGGKRAGAGRPPGRTGPGRAGGLIGGVLDHARALLVATLADETKPVELRACCAMALMFQGRRRGGGASVPGEVVAGPDGGDPIDPGEAGGPGPG